MSEEKTDFTLEEIFDGRLQDPQYLARFSELTHAFFDAGKDAEGALMPIDIVCGMLYAGCELLKSHNMPSDAALHVVEVVVAKIRQQEGSTEFRPFH